MNTISIDIVAHIIIPFLSLQDAASLSTTSRQFEKCTESLINTTSAIFKYWMKSEPSYHQKVIDMSIKSIITRSVGNLHNKQALLIAPGRILYVSGSTIAIHQALTHLLVDKTREIPINISAITGLPSLQVVACLLTRDPQHIMCNQFTAFARRSPYLANIYFANQSFVPPSIAASPKLINILSTAIPPHINCKLFGPLIKTHNYRVLDALTAPNNVDIPVSDLILDVHRVYTCAVPADARYDHRGPICPSMVQYLISRNVRISASQFVAPRQYAAGNTQLNAAMRWTIAFAPDSITDMAVRLRTLIIPGQLDIKSQLDCLSL